MSRLDDEGDAAMNASSEPASLNQMRVGAVEGNYASTVTSDRFSQRLQLHQDQGLTLSPRSQVASSGSHLGILMRLDREAGHAGAVYETASLPSGTYDASSASHLRASINFNRGASQAGAVCETDGLLNGYHDASTGSHLRHLIRFNGDPEHAGAVNHISTGSHVGRLIRFNGGPGHADAVNETDDLPNGTHDALSGSHLAWPERVSRKVARGGAFSKTHILTNGTHDAPNLASSEYALACNRHGKPTSKIVVYTKEGKCWNSSEGQSAVESAFINPSSCAKFSQRTKSLLQNNPSQFSQPKALLQHNPSRSLHPTQAMQRGNQSQSPGSPPMMIYPHQYDIRPHSGAFVQTPGQISPLQWDQSSRGTLHTLWTSYDNAYQLSSSCTSQSPPDNPAQPYAMLPHPGAPLQNPVQYRPSRRRAAATPEEKRKAKAVNNARHREKQAQAKAVAKVKDGTYMLGKLSDKEWEALEENSESPHYQKLVCDAKWKFTNNEAKQVTEKEREALKRIPPPFIRPMRKRTDGSKKGESNRAPRKAAPTNPTVAVTQAPRIANGPLQAQGNSASNAIDVDRSEGLRIFIDLEAEPEPQPQPQPAPSDWDLAGWDVPTIPDADPGPALEFPEAPRGTAPQLEDNNEGWFIHTTAEFTRLLDEAFPEAPRGTAHQLQDNDNEEWDDPADAELARVLLEELGKQ